MKQVKICLGAMLLLFSTYAFSQIKEPPLPPQIRIDTPPPPPPPKIKEGHPWTRNGENIWVATPPKPTRPIMPPPPPPPPPPKKYK